MSQSVHHPRLKLALREAIHANGGIECAARTVEKSVSLVGQWNNRNQPDLPTLGDAAQLDEGAMAAGQRPAILHRLAAELGHVAIRLPEVAAGDDALTHALVEVSAEFGDVACAVRDATADGHVSVRERQAIISEIDEAQAALARMRLLLAEGAAPVALRRAQEG